MQIIKVTPDKIDQLVDLSRRIFYDSFNHLNKPENMEANMNMAFTRQNLLSAPENENSIL